MQDNHKAVKKGMAAVFALSTVASIALWRSKPKAEPQRRISEPPAGLNPNRSLMSLAIVD